MDGWTSACICAPPPIRAPWGQEEPLCSGTNSPSFRPLTCEPNTTPMDPQLLGEALVFTPSQITQESQQCLGNQNLCQTHWVDNLFKQLLSMLRPQRRTTFPSQRGFLLNSLLEAFMSVPLSPANCDPHFPDLLLSSLHPTGLMDS